MVLVTLGHFKQYNVGEKSPEILHRYTYLD